MKLILACLTIHGRASLATMTGEARMKRWVWMMWVSVGVLMSGCSEKPDTNKPGWYLEKTGDAAVQIINVAADGKRQTWAGVLGDDSPKSSGLSPLPAGQDNGLFRWKTAGCAELSFVLAKDGLICTSCMQPVNFVPFMATCAIDQQILPVQGWTAVGLDRPR